MPLLLAFVLAIFRPRPIGRGRVETVEDQAEAVINRYGPNPTPEQQDEILAELFYDPDDCGYDPADFH